MKYFILQVLLLFFLSGIGQERNTISFDYLDDIAVAEKKYSAQKITFKANPNTVHYDIKYHRLNWEVDPRVAQIQGEVTTYFTANSDLSQIVFDLSDNMIVSKVEQRGNSLSFSQNSKDELIIDLNNTQKQGQLDSLTVSYSGNPVSSGFGSFEVNTHGPRNIPVLWTLSEPYGAKGWWPCKQDLIDKIDSVDIYIKHPDAYKAASNGLLMSEKTSGNSTLTHWKHKYPIPAYLVAIAVTDYAVYKGRYGRPGL